jgi:hypothetical protein
MTLLTGAGCLPSRDKVDGHDARNIIRMEEVRHLLADIHMPCSPCISGDEFAAAHHSRPSNQTAWPLSMPCGYSRYVKSTYIRLGAGR